MVIIFRLIPPFLPSPILINIQANKADSCSEKNSKMLSTSYRASIDPSVIHMSVRDAHNKNQTEATINKCFQKVEQ